MKYPGWETDAELEDEYQALLEAGIDEVMALELTDIQEEGVS